MAQLTIIAAHDDNYCIGLNGQLPWDIPEDRQHFRESTLGHYVIMGRKTFQSLPAPLDERKVIIVSSTLSSEGLPPDHLVVPDFLDAYEYAASQLLKEKADDETKIYVAGGSKIYEAALPFAERLELTHVSKMTPMRANDTLVYFPDWNRDMFDLVYETDFQYSGEGDNRIEFWHKTFEKYRGN